MERKIVAASYEGVNPKYLEFIQQRNAEIARRIASYKGLPFGESIAAYNKNEVYVIAPRTFGPSSKKLYNLSSPEDFYGLMIDDTYQVGKSILHPSISETPPSFYSADVAHALQDYVLPGYTAFSSTDVLHAYRSFDTKRFGCRLKSAGESDGNGQYAIIDSAHLQHVLQTQMNEEQISKEGVVLEPNVIDPKTISAGYFILNGKTMSFIGEQIDIKGSDGSNKYGGANLLVANGGFEELGTLVTDNRQAQALHSIKNFIAVFMNYGPVASRLSVDYLHGTDQYGNPLSGCTDITGRLGGTCPGLILAAQKFKDNPAMMYAKTSVHLNYGTTQRNDYESGAVTFVAHPQLHITARVEETG